MTAVAERTWSAPELADYVGATYRQIECWARRWHGPSGQGVRRRLTRVDALVARAWLTLGESQRAGTPETRRAWDRAKRAIRSDPRRWLLITPDDAGTHDTPSEAAQSWDGRGAATIIDCDPGDDQ